jgi:hypothetical protein
VELWELLILVSDEGFNGRVGVYVLVYVYTSLNRGLWGMFLVSGEVCNSHVGVSDGLDLEDSKVERR